MVDERFAESLVYIARHDAHGALGLIINQPIVDVVLSEVLHDLAIEMTVKPKGSVLYGGPVRPDVGFVLHTGQPSSWHSSVAVTENVCLTTSKDVLEAIATTQSVRNYQVCLGHAAWQPKQLEAEMAEGDWLTVAADAELLFSLPYHERLEAAMCKAGVNFLWLADGVGHA